MRKNRRWITMILCAALLSGMTVQTAAASENSMEAGVVETVSVSEEMLSGGTDVPVPEEQSVTVPDQSAVQEAAEEAAAVAAVPENTGMTEEPETETVPLSSVTEEQAVQQEAGSVSESAAAEISEKADSSDSAEAAGEEGKAAAAEGDSKEEKAADTEADSSAEEGGEEEEAEDAEAEEDLETIKNISLEYLTHVQTYGWETEWKRNGEMSGTMGESKRLEGIRIRLDGADEEDYIEYRTHVQTYGWETEWKRNGEMSGTEGQAKRLEGIQIRLSPSLEEDFDLFYCVHAQTYGWLGWAKNGEAAGTEGKAKRLEGIKIVLAKKGCEAPDPLGDTTEPFVGSIFRYQTHVQTYGWQDWVTDGQSSGTEGLSKRLEGICIQINPESMVSGLEGGVEYRTHVQTYGWETEWRHDGEMSGTEGQAKRLEGIQIRLTGAIAEKYDIYYRVHAQTYGWLDWAKNGESAGTEGLSKRLECIQIVAVQKGGAAPGRTKAPFRKALSSFTIPYAQPESGTRTIRNLLRTALVPCGRTLYSWGGGHGPDTNLTGMPQQWIDFFESHSTSTFEPSYDYIQYWNGVDCSGYSSWVVANTTGNYSGSAILAQSVAQVYAGNKWVTLIGTENQTFLPGDFVSVLYGHIWISLGQCSDGSTLLIHSAGNGIQLSGTGGKATQMAAYYMDKYFPYWPYEVGDYAWMLDEPSRTGRWITNGSGLLTDPDGMQKMSAEQVMQQLLGD